MGIDATASIGYGFKLPEAFVDDGDSDPIFDLLEPGLEIMSSGEEGSLHFYVVIKKSLIEVFHQESAKKLNLDKMMESYTLNFSYWDDVLEAWAKKHKLTKIKINWWMCASIS